MKIVVDTNIIKWAEESLLSKEYKILQPAEKIQETPYSIVPADEFSGIGLHQS